MVQERTERVSSSHFPQQHSHPLIRKTRVHRDFQISWHHITEKNVGRPHLPAIAPLLWARPFQACCAHAEQSVSEPVL